MPVHTYQIELIRKIKKPEWGPQAYISESKKHHIFFGRAYEVKTGKEAKKIAEEYANKHYEEASQIYIMRFNGGCGEGYLYKDQDVYFDK